MYYIIIGKLIVDPGEVEIIIGKGREKENNIIMDKTVQLGLQVWGKFIEEILRKHIQISHLKIGKFRVEKCVITTPISALSTVQEMDASIKEV